MCGAKDAGRSRRGSYVRVGVRCSELKPKGADKRQGRRLRRRRENIAALSAEAVAA